VSDDEAGVRTRTRADPIRAREASRKHYEKIKQNPEALAKKRASNRATYEKRKAAKADEASGQRRRASTPAMDAMVGARVRACRTAAGISTATAAEFLDVLPRQYSMYERGVTTMTAATLFQLSTFLRVSIDEFFYRAVPPSADPELEREVAIAFAAIPDQTLRARMLLMVERLAEMSRDTADRRDRPS
jgi:transcriptional regulator with XRE-family HTH domain